jgi:hypothetical protein
MKKTRLIQILLYLLLINSCVVQFIPDINEDQDLLVVEGTITDQLRVNTIKISRSAPLGINNFSKPLKGCKVWISDDLGINNALKETKDGTYVTDSTKFKGAIGRQYTLHIITTPGTTSIFNYESSPVEMKPVPPIDSIYYEKKVYVTWPQPVEGCQIYLDTHDPANNCKYYRWNYTETWEFHLPYNVTNRICYISDNSDGILIKNTSVLGEDKISRYPIYTITDPVDRLSVKYSILVNQYSLNEDEYHYWESLQNMSDQVGGLYDMIPSPIPSNIYCIENPDEKVLGYFSVSAVSSKRIFIKDNFQSVNDLYFKCITDTIIGTGAIPGLNSSVWVIVDNSNLVPPKRYITDIIGCADCRARGSITKPSFWDNGK